MNRRDSKWTLLVSISVVAILCAFILGYSVAGILPSGYTISETQTAPSTDSVNVIFVDQNEKLKIKMLRELSDFNFYGSHFARTLALYDLMTQADSETLQRYWDEANHFESDQFRQQIQESILQRWTTREPLAALAAVSPVKNNTTRTTWMKIVFHEWSQVDLDGLLQYAEDVNLMTKEIVMRSILETREDLSPNELRSLARGFDNEWLAFELIDDLVIRPEIEWKNFLIEHHDQLNNLSDNQFKVLQHIAYSWVQSSGVVVFQKMRDSLPPSFSLYETTAGVSQKFMDTNPNLAIDLTIDRFQHEQERTYGRLAVELILEWSRVAPVEAFSHTKSINARGVRQKLQNWSIKNWSQYSPETLLQEVENLPQRLQTFAHTRALTEISSKSPQQGLALLNEITSGSTLYREVAKSLAGVWIQQDLKSTLEWIKTDPNIEKFRDKVMSSALQELSETNLLLAMQTALQQPLVKGKRGMESSIIRWMAYRGNLDIALSLLPQVRSGLTRSYSYNSVMQELLEQGDTERAWNLFIELSEIETEDLQLPLATLAQKSPSFLYDSLDQIEDLVVQAEAARLLYYHNKNNGRFTQTELEHLDKLIRSQPKSRMNRAYDRMYETMRENR